MKPEKRRRFFFEDGNVTFLVDATLYCVHQYFLSLETRQKASKETGIYKAPIKLKDVKETEFEAFLSILYPSNFVESDVQTVDGWPSDLHLATMWKFAPMRRLAILRLSLIASSMDMLVFGRKYAVEDWLVPAPRDLNCGPEAFWDGSDSWEVPPVSSKDITKRVKALLSAALKAPPAPVPETVEIGDIDVDTAEMGL
ncbi:hypothetical protein EW146_g1958 [Bondarzewia mesenterica]|uniref:BTB domain-containing protein n=1 Tax=Bondarzewia mesenterica TaxID=1095465 RepID=A0A4S4M4H9_9AGAM|nr:hypothetical protein EW146_g1958 [Bondarzewia mesenterica]